MDNSWLWHRRFCHIKFGKIEKKRSTSIVRDFCKIMKPTNVFCKEYIMAKQLKVSFPSMKFTTREKLEFVHIDLSGPIKTKGFYGERYFMILLMTSIEVNKNLKHLRSSQYL